MSKNGDEDSDQDFPVDDDSSDDGYSDDDWSGYEQYYSPLMYYVPEQTQLPFRRFCRDAARLSGGRESVKRITYHFPITQQQFETCMQENCNKLTSGKCGRCHAFLCIDSENECFRKFHDIFESEM